MSNDLKDTYIVITGAGRGLGAALAICLADLGASIILCGRSAARLGKVAAAIESRVGRSPAQVVVDLADTASVEAACDQILATAPIVDILINNGAAWLEARNTPYTSAEVTGVINSALTGTFLLTQALLPSLKQSPRPDVVTIGSISSLLNSNLHNVAVPFYMAKHGQTALADGLRQMFIGTPVRSIAIHPPGLKDISPLDAEWDNISQTAKDAPVTNRDIVEAVVFAITRPRRVTVASMLLDGDVGGVFHFDRTAG
jgi:NADP-dependent 3-hydroxy acid dehydrogenase YdfG